MGRLSRSLLAAAVCVLALLSAAPAQANAVDRYVALGDSFASSPLTPLFVQPYGCLRSTHNYAGITARRLRIKDFEDVTCAGASTRHMYDSHGVTPGPANPPQLDALTPETDLVTLQIGGNDIGFGSIATDCLSLFDPRNAQCTQQFNADGVDQISARIATAKTRVAGVITDIRERAPEARILFVNYSRIFPERAPYCWPFMPIAAEDVPYLRDKHEELNATLAEAAAEQDVEVIDVYAASRRRHACNPPALRWVEPVAPFVLGAPVHPNLQHNLAVSRLIRTTLRG